MTDTVIKQEPIDIPRMATLAAEIERLRYEFQPMPDAIMDHLTEARFALAATVMATPSTGMVDLAAKLQMLGATNGDDSSFDISLFDGLAVCTRDAETIWNEQYGPRLVVAA